MKRIDRPGKVTIVDPANRKNGKTKVFQGIDPEKRRRVEEHQARLRNKEWEF